MTEQQSYHVVEVLQRDPLVEVRDYDACTVADVVVHGDLERAGSAAFGPLVGYISSHKLAMTAPVLQEEGAGPGDWQVSFVLPGGQLPSAYPLPSDARVALREVLAHRAVALRWSGRWTAKALEQRTAQMQDIAIASGLRLSGAIRWARYDPPWTPPFMRRNEVIVAVAEGSQP